MLGQRRRRWPKIKPTLVRWLFLLGGPWPWDTHRLSEKECCLDFDVLASRYIHYILVDIINHLYSGSSDGKCSNYFLEKWEDIRFWLCTIVLCLCQYSPRSFLGQFMTDIWKNSSLMPFCWYGTHKPENRYQIYQELLIAFMYSQPW